MEVKPWKYNKFALEIDAHDGLKFLIDEIDLRNLLKHPGFLHLRDAAIYAEQAKFPNDCDWNRYHDIARFWDYFYGKGEKFREKIFLYPGTFDHCPCCELKALIGDIEIFSNAIVWKNFLIEPSSSSDDLDELNQYKNFTFVFDRKRYNNQLEKVIFSNADCSSSEITNHFPDFITPSRHNEKIFSFTANSFNLHQLTIDGKNWDSPYHFYKENKLLNSDDSLQRVEFMTRGLLECVFQSADFFDYLDSFGPTCFIRVIGDDPFWNCTANGYGRNMLGYVLMAIRDTINSTEILPCYVQNDLK